MKESMGLPVFVDCCNKSRMLLLCALWFAERFVERFVDRTSQNQIQFATFSEGFKGIFLIELLFRLA